VQLAGVGGEQVEDGTPVRQVTSVRRIYASK